MGQCQSRSVMATEHAVGKDKGNPHTSSPLRMFRIRHDKGDMESPTTPGTKTISPSDNTESTLDSIDLSESDHGMNLLSVLSSPSNQKLATFPEEDEDEEDDVEEDDFDQDGDNGSNHYVYGVETPSLLYSHDFESGIPEEEDPDAPSDEEDFHEAPKWRDRAGPLVSSSLASRVGRAPLTTSPPRTQASIKLRKGRVTNPQSIVHRPETPLVAPNEVQKNLEIARNAVKPHTMSEFNRLKVQVKLAKRQEKVKSRASKLEDRYEDVRGYKNLWNDYEMIERKLSDVGSESGTPASEGHPLKRSTSFDLKDSDSWFFDFQSIDGSEDEDDNESQCHLSLLSESSMEAQRLLFAEKSAERYRRAEKAKLARRTNRKNKKIAEGARTEECDGEEKKMEETPHSQGAAQPALSTPRELFRGKMEDEDSQASESKASSYSQSHLRSSGRDYGPARNHQPEVPITSMEVSFAQGRHRLIRTDSDLDDNTSQLSVDVEDDNDYHVSRRRRRHRNGDDGSVTSGITSTMSYDEERMELASASEGDMYGLDNLSLHSSEAANEAELNPVTVRESPPKPAFGAATYMDRPEPRWREFANVKEQVLMNNTAKCLRDVFSTKALLSTELENDDVAFADDEEKLIQIMSTDEFFRMSDGLANPIRLHLPAEKRRLSDYGGSPKKVDYGPARDYSPKKTISPSKVSPKSPISSISHSISDGVNNVLNRIRNADNTNNGEAICRNEAKSPKKRSPFKNETPHDEPGVIIMGTGQDDVYSLRNVLSASSPDSPAERYMV